MNRFMRILVWLPALALCTSASGCGGDGGNVIQGMPTAGRPARAQPTPEAPPAAPPPDQAQEGPRRDVVKRDWPETTRDPFTRPFPAETTITSAEDLIPSERLEPTTELGPLAEYPIETLRLVMIMTRAARPVAMFQVPDGNRSQLAYIGDRVGPNGSGIIEDIEPNQVVIRYEGDPRRTTDATTAGSVATNVRRAYVHLRGTPADLEGVNFDPY